MLLTPSQVGLHWRKVLTKLMLISLVFDAAVLGQLDTGRRRNAARPVRLPYYTLTMPVMLLMSARMSTNLCKLSARASQVRQAFRAASLVRSASLTLQDARTASTRTCTSQHSARGPELHLSRNDHSIARKAACIRAKETQCCLQECTAHA